MPYVLSYRLHREGVQSLEALADITELQLQRVSAPDRSLRDYGRLKARVADLRTDHPTDYHQLKARQWKKLLEKVNVHKWSLGEYTKYMNRHALDCFSRYCADSKRVCYNHLDFSVL